MHMTMKSRDRCELNTRTRTDAPTAATWSPPRSPSSSASACRRTIFLVLSGEDPSALAVCLERDAGMTEKSTTSRLSAYFRYETAPAHVHGGDGDFARLRRQRHAWCRSAGIRPVRSGRSDPETSAPPSSTCGEIPSTFFTTVSNIDANDTSIDATGTDAQRAARRFDRSFPASPEASTAKRWRSSRRSTPSSATTPTPEARGGTCGTWTTRASPRWNIR